MLRCRAVAVALLGLKGIAAMRELDRWVVREMVFGCWATRPQGVEPAIES